MMRILLGMGLVLNMVILGILAACSAVGAEPSLFAPSPFPVIIKSLELAQTTKSDIVYDLGCGDGRVVITAAKLYGCRGVGVDYDKDCVDLASRNVKLNNVDAKVTIRQEDALNTDLSPASIIYLYLMPELTSKLLKTLKYKLDNGAQIIAHDKPVYGLVPHSVTEVVVDQQPHRIYLYKAAK